jgi:hypothetical protein
MTPDERKLLAELFDRVQSAAGNRRDPEAEAFIAEKVRAQPYAPYLLAQAVIVQEEGLKNALARIEQLEREVADAKAQPAGGGSFLGSIFGGGQRAAEQSQPAPGPWSHQRSSVPSVGPQTGGWGGQQMQPQQAMQQPQGGSFLKGALGAAAGVGGGVLLANSLQGLFSGGNNAHGIAGDTASAGAAGASSANSDITGGIFDSKPAAAPTPAAEPASYDDGSSGWDSGGDDGSFDA